MLCNNCVITSITWCITCSTPYYMHYMLFYMRITCSIIQHNPITCSITCHLHDQLHAITCSTVLLHAPLHANYMINYMLDYMQHHSITCSITWQLHNQLHDLLHTQLTTITCIEWHKISWAHDHVFLAPPSTPKKSPSFSASGAQDRRRRLWRLMRGLLERILLSCHKHENTGLESVLRPLPAKKSIYSYKTNKQINDTGFQYLRNLCWIPAASRKRNRTVLGSTN